jgi:aminoglycoside phosphotransferase (APT) family kinase protein
LPGGVAGATHLVTVDGSTRLVLKRYPPEEWARDAASLEWERLGYASSSAVVSPRRIALDAEGQCFGTPALVMSYLDGQVDLFPADLRRWLQQLAKALVVIHDTRVGVPPGSALLRPQLVQRWEPWWEQPYAGADDATGVIAELAAALNGAGLVFSHDDYHPGNVLFVSGTLSGVVDWSAAKLAPRESDVAACRADLAIHPGGDAPRLFRLAYENETGHSLQDLWAWDVLQADKVIHYGPTWTQSFADFGLKITPNRIQDAGLRHLHRALTGASR